jgi:N-methylhydantoinase A/oxoprolinase/acetone carboxylase beta subunit
MDLGLGIDTGGTYTDSAIVDLATGKVLTKAKALTTRNDLSIGISGSIDKLEGIDVNDIRLVSVSSTLATNSVVEGKGCRVGLIVVGNEYVQTIPLQDVCEVRGGHNLVGEEKEALDLKLAEGFVHATSNKVDGYAVSSYLSVRNPEHEVAVKRMIEAHCRHPVVCGHELSSQLGFHERTITAVLNAKLIPIIADLLHSVRKVLKERGIDAPLMIVKGDGSLMGELVARYRPVETVLSGPAASLIGARYLTQEEDGVVIDVGGTTTDIGILRKGKPRLDPEGALIGGWRTRVKAADISTSGIGGDSRVVVSNGRIMLSPLRVVPLCIASSQHPCILTKLKTIVNEKQRPQATHIALENIIQNDEFFIHSKDMPGFEASLEESAFINLVKQEPRTIYEVAAMTGIHPYSFNVRRLEELGIVQRIGLTPTDILHASGEYVEYDAAASRIAVDIQAEAMEMTPSHFCAEVKTEVIHKIARELINKLLYEETGKTAYCEVTADLITKSITHKAGVDYSMRMSLHKPIIGIGAPVAAYLPRVAQQLHTRLLLPDHSEVGNAIGAIMGSIIESAEVLIRPKPGVSAMENPPCILHSADEKREFNSLEEAVDYARIYVTEVARKKAVAAGADEIEMKVDRDDKVGHLGKSWGTGIMLETKVVATAIGKPRFFFEARR